MNKTITIICIIIFVVVAAFAMTDTNGPNKTFETGRKQLENQGYTQVENTGHQWMCCGEGDTYSIGFKCLSKNGEVVTGCICGGYSKGVTIRYQ